MPWFDGDAPTPRPNGKGGSALDLIDPATLEFKPIPQRQWMVTDWVPMSRATSLYGSGGEEKTLLTQMLTTAAALGRQWLGLPVRQCNSLLLFAEDDQDEMHRRQADINAHFGCSFLDLGAMRWLPRLGADNTLMTFDGGRARHAPLFDQLLLAARQHEAELVIVDTLADVFAGNENDRSQARTFAQAALGHLARELSASVIVLAHPSLQGAANGNSGSGSTAWKGTFRSQLYLESPKPEDGEELNPDVRVLRRAKANYARRDETIELRWRDGVFVPLHAASGIIASIEKRTCERVFLDLLDRVLSEGRHVSDNCRTHNYAPRIFAQRPDRERFRKSDFERAMQGLFAARAIAVGSYRGPNRHDHDCIIRTAET